MGYCEYRSSGAGVTPYGPSFCSQSTSDRSGIRPMHADTDHEHVSTDFDCTDRRHERHVAAPGRPGHCQHPDHTNSLFHREFTLAKTYGRIGRVPFEADTVPRSGTAVQ